MNPKIIEQYAGGGEKLAQAIRGLNRDDLLAVPVPGAWSIQQIVIHLMDSDLISTDRMKRMIAEDNPTLLGYDQSEFAESLYYDQQPVADAVAIFDQNRKLFARVLGKLPDEAFSRVGTHNERGKLTLAQYLQAVVNHLEHHLKFIVEKREKIGKT